jgi:flagellar hook-length control protein FliK
MMPTPVKNLFAPAAGGPVKPGRASATEGAIGESFRDELVRRRDADAAKSDAAKAEAAKPQAAKAEPKRGTKSRKPTRGRRREPAPPSEAPEFGAAPAGETDASVSAPAVDEVEPADLAGAPGGVEGDPSAEAETDSTVSGPGATLAVTAVPAAPQSAQPQGADGVTTGVDTELTAPARDAAARADRPAVYHGGGPIDPEDAAEGADPDAAAPSAGTAAALFTDNASGPGEGETTPDEGRKSPAPAGMVTDDAMSGDAAGAVPEFETPAQTADTPVRTAGDADTLLAAMSAPGDGRAEARTGAAPSAGPALPALPPEVRFASANHENIVTSMRAELMPNGGSMRIRLDPPQLGALQVTVQIVDGMVTASFETSNDEATRLLGHSLNQLKTVLESHGVAVDKLQVQQAPREAQTSSSHDEGHRERGGQSREQEHDARQEQQRREMLQKMWRRLSGQPDPLDLTA